MHVFRLPGSEKIQVYQFGVVGQEIGLVHAARAAWPIAVSRTFQIVVESNRIAEKLLGEQSNFHPRTIPFCACQPLPMKEPAESKLRTLYKNLPSEKTRNRGVSADKWKKKGKEIEREKSKAA